MTTALWIVGAYLVGAIPASFLAARLGAGLDLREHGSKNLGATNVYRVLGWRFAIPVALFDVSKGLGPVALARSQFDQLWLPVVIGLSAVIGHVFSVFVRFKGGKGVATASGVVLGLAPLALLGAAGVWGVTLTLSGFVSLSSMVAALSFPLLVWLIYPTADTTLLLGVGLALFILFTHRSNIRRLIDGTENRFSRSATSAGRA
ncbi:MAG TPA: glycerol-3-phosphate 1-O-acyltransferase PlsY [Gemmatimonadales bacterium]